VTEAGSGLAARVKSAIGIGTLLQDGIGDTVRVSLTEDSVHEIPVCREISLPFRPAFAAPPAAAAADDPGGQTTALPPGNPLLFARRDIQALGQGEARLGRDNTPRIELLVDIGDTQTVQRLLATTDQPDLIVFDVSGQESDRNALQQQLAALQGAKRAPLWGLQIPASAALDSPLVAQLPSGARLALGVEAADVANLPQIARQRPDVALQYTLHADLVQDAAGVDRILTDVMQQRLPFGAVALASRGSGTLAQTWRGILARHRQSRVPIVLQEPVEGAFDGCNTPLHSAMALGALLVDGIGDALQLRAGKQSQRGYPLMREILQATRLRLTVADFIACPSCGRTQFDLQTTSARIQARFRHLNGLKIAVMGCIVNGPGEMADADFGYVGSGPGKIDLYVGQERVERAIAAADAVDRLEELIRAQGRWNAPADAHQSSDRNQPGPAGVST
jgi:(E)-4-hydroxy-3-methylbut-2-enyl-diphosphate synthase